MNRNVFPFSAVMGQDKIKKALIWNFINPRIGGVLLSGQKGTAKSTLVRASEMISGKKVVELPLNITEDRLIGSIDFEKAIREGKRTLDPGLLLSAHQNILYADEINLLSENIVKALLEASSMGVCRVEREGIQEKYPCEFILIGSMNPEEGAIRPQLLDRFGLYVDVTGEENALIRCEIIRRRLYYEKNPEIFRRSYEKEEWELAERICKAKERLSEIVVSENALKIAAELAMSVNAHGNRGEIALIETARAICAYDGIASVNKEALLEAAKYALVHRMRDKDTKEASAPENDTTKDNTEDKESKNTPDSETQFPREKTKNPENERNLQEQSEEEASSENLKQEENENPGLSEEEKSDASGEMFEVCKWLENNDIRKKISHGSGRRSLVKTSLQQGRYVKSIPGDGNDLAFDATLRAAAPYQKSREKNGLAFAVRKSDFRQKVREKRTGNFLVFVVDASGSMGAGKRMTAVKGAILSLLSDAYQKRDKVALITFRQERAELVLGMTRSIDLAAKKMEMLSTGGKTPLYAGLEMAYQVIKAAEKKEKDLMPVLILVSDGRATAGKSDQPFADALSAARVIAAEKKKSVVIDVEQGFIKLHLAEKLAKEMNAEVYQLSGLHADAILSAVNQAVHK